MSILPLDEPVVVCQIQHMIEPGKTSQTVEREASSGKAIALFANGPLLTERQAAAILQLSPRTLRIARQRGELTYQQFGRSIRYTAAEVEGFVIRATVANDRSPTKSTRCVRTRATATIIPFSKL